jgi:hypothetical protein
MLELVSQNLLSPPVLAFALGFIAVLCKSDLKFPESVYLLLSTYLLFSIGLKGGVALSETSLEVFWKPCLATVFLSILLPIMVYNVCRKVARISDVDAASMAAHYGSVSAVTFIAAKVFMASVGHEADGYVIALVAILEVPAIIIALLLVSHRLQSSIPLKEHFQAIFFSKSILLLWGGMLIGYLSGPEGLLKVKSFFVDPFQGVLVLFLLDMGVVAATRAKDLLNLKRSFFALAIIFPIFNGILGVYLGYLAEMSLGSMVVLGAMSGSASYIAAPAAIRVALPKANPALSLTSALVITFPFNLTVGIPLFYQVAQWLVG